MKMVFSDANVDVVAYDSTTTVPPLATATTTIDAGVLRKALRLIHCLQKERGASCAYRAASANIGGAPFRTSAKPLVPARRDADRAFIMLLHNSNRHRQDDNDMPVEMVTLDKIRKMVMEHKNSDGSVVVASAASVVSSSAATPRSTVGAHPNELNPGFHQILVCYNTLIQSILHDYVLRYTAVAAKHRRDAHRINHSAVATTTPTKASAKNSNSPNSNSNSALLYRVSSHQALKQLYSASSHQRKHKRTQSSDSRPTISSSAPSSLLTHRDVHSFASDPGERFSVPSQYSDSEMGLLNPRQPPPPAPSTFPLLERSGSRDEENTSDDGFAFSSEQQPQCSAFLLDGILIEPPQLSPVLQVSEKKNEESAASTEVNEDDTYDDEERVFRLLNLLDTFVRLKESTGVERAILSSMLAAGQVDIRLMLTDLVLEVENQRSQVGKLAKLLPKTGVLYDLVQELVSMSPQMKQLQNSILQGFDLDLLKSKFDSQGELWNLLTLYMDKLHSLELLIVEEIECCVGIQSHDNAPLVVDYSNSTERHLPTKPATAVSSVNSASERINWNEVFGMAVGSTCQDLRSRIESMTPEDVKQRLLAAAALTVHDNPHALRDGSATNDNDGVIISATGKGVDDLLAELSKAPASKEWEIDLYEIRFLKRIGQGNAGTTYLADWSGLKVAVKVASISEMGLDGWRTEVQALQKLHHPNIIRLLGSVYHPSPLTFCLVLEYCDAGDLSEALKRVTPPSFFFRVGDGMSKGGGYLHKKGVIHRDIKPGNVLLEGDVASGQFKVKLTDFGVATDVALSGDRTAETGTYRWMAGEVIRHEKYSQSADVYSFAVVLWQLITREDPFQDKSQVEAAASVAFENARPPFPEGTPKAVVKLIETCWSNEPDGRLPFEQIITELQTIETQLTTDETTWIEAPLGHSVYRSKTIKVSQTYAFLQVPSQQKLAEPNQQHDEKKKKGFRTLFNRKSVHF